MEIFVNVKSPGRRRPVLEKRPCTLPGAPATLRALLAAVVEAEVARYNAKSTETALVPFLTSDALAEQVATGKVGFGWRYADKKADAAKAVENALQGFEDGLYRVLVNDVEWTGLDDAVQLAAGDTLTFIRLAMLSGRLW